LETHTFFFPNFAAKFIQTILIMQVITIESQAYRELEDKLETILQFIAAIKQEPEENPENIWVDNYEVCTFLKISTKTLQRMRDANLISYSRIRGKIFYKVSELQRLMEDKVIRRSEEHLQDLIKNHRLYVEQREAIRTNK
jgi:3-methyladenine DNA glycosylase Tag